MAAGVGTEPVTAHVFLFGAGSASAQDLARALDVEGVTGTLASRPESLPRSVRTAVSAEIARMVEGLLDFDLGGILTAAWRDQADLRAAARRTVAAPGA